MKRFLSICSVITVLWLFFISCIPSNATLLYMSDETLLSGEKLTDSLDYKTHSHIYDFDLTEKGDAVILIKSMQDGISAFTYYWTASLYTSDMTPISKTPVEGSGKLTVISLDNIDKGKYYLEITSASSSNPLLSGFTTEPYEITLLSLYHSFTPEFKSGIQVFDKDLQIIGKIDDTFFIKVGEGAAYGAFYRNSKGALIPILVSKDSSAVNYIVSSTGQYTKTYNSPNIKKDGTTYYHTSADWIDKYSEKKEGWVSKESANYKYIDKDTDSSAAKSVLKAVEKNEKGAFMYYLSNYWHVPLCIIVMIAFLALTSLLKYDGPA